MAGFSVKLKVVDVFVEITVRHVRYAAAATAGRRGKEEAEGKKHANKLVKTLICVEGVKDERRTRNHEHFISLRRLVSMYRKRGLCDHLFLLLLLLEHVKNCEQGDKENAGISVSKSSSNGWQNAKLTGSNVDLLTLHLWSFAHSQSLQDLLLDIF